MKVLRPSKEETRARILGKADELFRQYGFSKTTVADIAAELGMSPANVYKFFPSKEAIIQSNANQNLAALQADVRRAVRAKKGALDRLETLVLTVAKAHLEICKNDRQIHKIFLLAMEEDWQCIHDMDSFLEAALTQILEDGIESREFRQLDAPAIARILLASLTPFTHPLLLQAKLDSRDVEARLHETILFLKHALT
jgi:AcrR family transcriptional regulator